MPVDDPIAEARRQWIAHGWDSAADGMAMVTSVSRVHQLLTERIDVVLRPYQLTFARFEILRLLAFTKRGALPMSKLGARLQVHAASVTSAVSRLEDQGYVERTQSEEDKRVFLATITEDGRAVIEKATTEINAEVFGRPALSERDQASLVDLLTRYRVDVGDVAEKHVAT